MKFGGMSILIVSLLVIASTSFANNFGNTETSAWADTPMGKFICNTSNDNKQVLTIDNKEIYRTPKHLEGCMGEAGAKLLSQGIYLNPRTSFGTSCPNIIENKAGYVVYEEEIPPSISGNTVVDKAFPPVEGLLGYTIINFNVTPPTLIQLFMEAQSREGKKYEPHFTWDDKSFTMRYYGYPYNTNNLRFYPKYPKARFHTIRFDFATQKISCIN